MATSAPANAQNAGGGAAASAAPAATGQPVSEQQLFASFLRDICALALPTLYRYLKDQAPTHEVLTPGIQVLTQATQLYEAGEYAKAYEAIYGLYRALTLARLQHPDLPEVTLRTG